ncbi:hypothetical protein FHW79_005349 [Azospirillum sp. OGB3]|uniref:hypothetical protein n=1 Tax=Azospirillum sp. OGB3 TaxID=2587012 RepID=UPI001606AD53|nr:hypothetical protein [Azospirillum sp. OGB3]MBB3267684.1 hypothetical protein [Azospirillum sp. OGB3]
MTASIQITNSATVSDEGVTPDSDQQLLLVCVHEVGHTIVEMVLNQTTAGCEVYRTESGEWLGKAHATGGNRPTDRSGWVNGAASFFGGFAAVELAVREGRLPPCPDGERIERYFGYAGSVPWMPSTDADLQTARTEGRYVSDEAAVEWCTWCGSGNPLLRDETVRTEALERARSILADYLSLIMELAAELAEHKALQAERIAVVLVEHGVL